MSDERRSHTEAQRHGDKKEDLTRGHRDTELLYNFFFSSSLIIILRSNIILRMKKKISNNNFVSLCLCVKLFSYPRYLKTPALSPRFQRIAIS